MNDQNATETCRCGGSITFPWRGMATISEQIAVAAMAKWREHHKECLLAVKSCLTCGTVIEKYTEELRAIVHVQDNSGTVDPWATEMANIARAALVKLREPS